jgi:hypothetical protein
VRSSVGLIDSQQKSSSLHCEYSLDATHDQAPSFLLQTHRHVPAVCGLDVLTVYEVKNLLVSFGIELIAAEITLSEYCDELGRAPPCIIVARFRTRVVGMQLLNALVDTLPKFIQGHEKAIKGALDVWLVHALIAYYMRQLVYEDAPGFCCVVLYYDAPGEMRAELALR